MLNPDIWWVVAAAGVTACWLLVGLIGVVTARRSK